MNAWGKQHRPFIFLIDFEMEKPLLFPLEEAGKHLLWATPFSVNTGIPRPSQKLERWEIEPVSFSKYKKGFGLVKTHIQKGDTFLLNFTQPTPVGTNLSIEDIFYQSHAPYRILLKNEFVCFSPEIFVRIENNRIFSFPMKGTIDALAENAEELILNDTKEIAEHHTIVDLIRNDLSRVAENVEVRKFRYLGRIKTNRKELLQVSSEISGTLHENYCSEIGDILLLLLPAGSVSGAPKPKTLEIIRQAEGYKRGYYTGVFGIFDGCSLDSCVLIRYIENQGGKLVYKSGGGITFMSDCQSEYNELIQKVYVPVI